MMPFMDGLEVTRRLRLQAVATPVLLLTARDAPEDVVRGLDAGADDYLTKPFSFDLLLARIRARTRLPEERQRQTLRYAHLMMDLGKREVWRGLTKLRRTRTDFAILECLMRSARRVVSRDQLIQFAWGDRDVSVQSLEISEGDKAKILGENAVSLFRLG